MKQIYLFQARNNNVAPSARAVIGTLPYFPETWEKVPHAIETTENNISVVTFNLTKIWHDVESDSFYSFDDMMAIYADVLRNDYNGDVESLGTFPEYLSGCMDYNNGALEDALSYMREYCADAMREYYSAYEDYNEPGGYFHE